MRTAALALLLVLHASALQAQPLGEDAQQLFDQARAELAQGQYSEACPKLERSQALDPQLGTLLHLAHCYEKIGRLSDAWNRFQAAALLAHGQDGLAEPREAVAQRRAAALEPRISLVTFAIAEPDLPGMSIEHDGSPLPRERWTRPLAVEPGTHRASVRAPNRQPWQYEYTIGSEPARVPIVVPALALP
ncbi:MAG TPA: hypothetical protein VJR89_19255, partial [Polyangiales bacterium]|nr:hypothetical protein [Polyangiales bacterium]